MEYFTLSGTYGKWEGDTITYLHEAWPQSQSRVGFARDDIGTVFRAVDKGNKSGEEILWTREILCAHMTHLGDTVLYDVKEVFMPLTGVNFFNMKNVCNTADHASNRWTQHCCHGLTWDPWDNENVWRVLQVFSAFMGFCRNLGVAMSFLKGNKAEADRLRSWFKMADSTFDLTLDASADWRYIAPKRREQTAPCNRLCERCGGSSTTICVC